MKNKVFQSGIWYICSNFLVKSMVLITTPIFTRILTKNEFGEYSNFVSWISIFQIISTLNLQSTLLSAKFDYKENFEQYVFSILNLSTFSVGIWILIMNIFSEKVKNIIALNMYYLNGIFIYLIFMTPILLFQIKEQFFYRYKKSIMISLTLSITTALLSIILVVIMHDKLQGRIIGSVLPTIIVGFIIYVLLARQSKGIRIYYWKYALPICLPYIPHLLSMTLLNSVDRVMIARYCGMEYTALYSVAYMGASVVTVIINSLNEAFVPWLGDRLSNNEFQKIRKFSYLYVSIFICFAGGMLLLTPEILMILGGKSYIDAQYIMPPIAMGCVCQFLYTMFVNVEQFKKKTTGMAIASSLAALINYVLNVLYIPKYGYIAAAYTTFIGFFCLLIMHMFLVRRLNLQDVYNYKFIFIVVIIMFLIMFIINYLYSHTMLRILIISIYVILFGGVAIMIFKKYRN